MFGLNWLGGTSGGAGSDFPADGASGAMETDDWGLPGAGLEGQPGSPALSQDPGPPAPDEAQQAALATAAPDLAISSPPAPAPASEPVPHQAPARGAGIVGLLQAEQDAWLARDTQAHRDAQQATNQAMAVQTPDITKTQWQHLGEAIEFWRGHGHLEVQTEDSTVLLFAFLKNLHTTKGRASLPDWACQVLDVLGMRWWQPGAGLPMLGKSGGGWRGGCETRRASGEVSTRGRALPGRWTKPWQPLAQPS